ncbi:flavodoxin domain-containing protein [Litoribrevibacter albus]|uniref:Flavodoxin n=1 Tax=Litoribrevibacter albus TaxID=1473156 RepID=A0AA37W5T3_9GAMM|nr:flavodoxin domain-containing protein [Litoribrevibacter albus]GLQ29773.1 flavodoxin [Litoribrevibacter albus]
MANITVVYGSVRGNAKTVAETATQLLNTLGHKAELVENPTAALLQSPEMDALLICTSTTGQGDIPQNLVGLYIDIQDKFPMMTNKKAGIIALGDSSYPNFCGAGEKFEELMYELQCGSVSRVTVDATETTQPMADAEPWLKEWATTL